MIGESSFQLLQEDHLHFNVVPVTIEAASLNLFKSKWCIKKIQNIFLALSTCYYFPHLKSPLPTLFWLNSFPGWQNVNIVLGTTGR